MPVWKVPAVDAQSLLTLRDWTVLELSPGTRHVVGHCVENREGRVSTAVVDFDLSAMRATTESGRVYVLQGEPGFSDDGYYVWRRFSRLNNVPEFVDVTASVWAAHLGARQPERQHRPPSHD